MTDTYSNTTSTVPSPDDWLVRHVERQFREAEILQTNKTVLLRALARAGISSVLVIFDGRGDSGEIRSVEVRIGNTRVTFPDHQVEIRQLDWEEAEPRRHKMSLVAAVRTIFWDILAAQHCERADNDGGLREFAIDVPGNRITLDDDERRYESCAHAFEGGHGG